MAITTYAELKTAIPDYVERAADAAYVAQVDTFIDLSEAYFNRKLNTYRRETEATVTTNASGVATLPTDVRNIVSLVNDDTPTAPLRQVDWNVIDQENPHSVSGIPDKYAIMGTSLRVSPITAADFTFTYAQSLPALSVSQTTNWLLDLAPDAYLFECIAQGYVFLEQEQRAALFEAKANSILDEIYSQDLVTQYGRAELMSKVPTP